MSSLALREQLLLGSVLAAVLAGVAVKHWRDARREAAAAVASPGPGVPSPSSGTHSSDAP